jgi:hypothetical protein
LTPSQQGITKHQQDHRSNRGGQTDPIDHDDWSGLTGGMTDNPLNGFMVNDSLKAVAL